MSETQTLTPDKAREQAEDTQIEQAKAASKEASEEAKKTGRKAGRAARLVVTETGYATLGLGGVTIDLVRHTPSAVRTVGLRTADGVKVAGMQVVRGFAALSRRGHAMLGSASLPVRREHDAPASSERSSEQPTPAPVAEPPVAVPAVAEPAVTGPPVVAPTVTRPPVAEPTVAEPPVGGSAVDVPAGFEPAGTDDAPAP